MNIDIVELLKMMTDPLNPGPHYIMTSNAIKEIEALRSVGRKVVDARYYSGDEACERLKLRIKDLEELVGRS